MLIGVVMAALSACNLEGREPPEHFVLAPAASECPNLNGVYHNREMEPREHPANFSNFVRELDLVLIKASRQSFKKATREEAKALTGQRTAQYFTIHDNPQSLVRIEHDTDKSLTIIFSRDLYYQAPNEEHHLECKDGWLEIEYPLPFRGGNPMLGYSDDRLLLSKAQDGSLLLQRGYTDAGLALWGVPMAEDVTDWYRFMPYTGQ